MALMDKVRRMVSAARGDAASRYVLVERAARRVHPDAILSEEGREWLHDADFRAAYERFDPHNYRRLDRAWNLMQLARYTKDLPGDTAECGVLGGLTSFFICRETQEGGRVHHAFDSFQGLSTPAPIDGYYWARGDLSAPVEDARLALAQFESIEFHVGWIPERFSAVSDRKFSLVHIDVDLYQPTKDSLEFFLPRMSPRGVIVLDDYGFEICPGARAAADEVCVAAGRHIVELSSGQGIVFL